MTEMQAFCLNARKSIEIANLLDNSIIHDAYEIKLKNAGEKIEAYGVEDRYVTNKNFMWIIGRIIHSVSTVVQSTNIIEESTATKIYSQNKYIYFGFGSDNDKASASPAGYVTTVEQMHYITIEDFLACFFDNLNRKIQNAIKILRPPLKIS